MIHAADRRLLSISFLASFAAAPAHAQCTASWSPQFAARGLDNTGYTALLYDDGGGMDLYVGGRFTGVNDVAAARIARFDGSTWTPVGIGMDGDVLSLAAYRENGVRKLFAGGSFDMAGGVGASRIARWDGTAWTPVGAGLVGRVHAAVAYPPTGVSQLYVGGSITSAGGVAVNNVAKWDGTSWSVVGSGYNGIVRAMVVHDVDGAGPNPPELFVAGDSSFNDVFRWNGTTWTQFAGPVAGIAVTNSLASYTPTGGGTPLLVAALETKGFAPTVHAWDGATWTALAGSGSSNGGAGAVTVFDAGTGHGNAIYVERGQIQRWTGSGWVAEATLGGGVAHFVSGTIAGSPTPHLYAVGGFGGIGGEAMTNIARWDGVTWSGFGAGGHGVIGQIRVLGVHDDGNGPALYAGGSISVAGGTFSSGVNRLMRWNGSSWSEVAGGLSGNVYELTSFDDGGGAALYALGDLFAPGPGTASDVLRWNGSTWTIPGSGLQSNSGAPFAACVYDDGSGAALYVGGSSVTIGVGGPATTLAKWDGTAWSAVPNAPTGFLRELCVYDDGGGDALFATGSFSSAGSTPVANIAKWDGTSWSALGAGLNGVGNRLLVTDVGSGRELVVGGVFTTAGGALALHIARWNGAQWNPIGAGVDEVSSLASYDDGTGPVLIVGKSLPAVAGSPYLFAWNGSAWIPFAGSINDGVDQLQIFDDGSGPALFVGGRFTLAGGVPSTAIARYDGCSFVGTPFCFGDGSGTACPCANDSPASEQRGCLNSFGKAGRLTAHGVTSLSSDSAVLTVRDVPAVTCVVFQGTAQVNGGLGSINGDGLICAGGSLVRIITRPAIASGVLAYPVSGDLSLHVKGFVLAPGTRAYQVVYRNSQAFCTSATFNYSNGYELDWVP